jgi:DNA-binding NtrC family response regulator
VRIISATNKDLLQAVHRGNFRDDLYYRLNVIPIQIPPLRARKTDIALLVDHFLQEAAGRNQRKPLIVSQEAMALMLDYAWPGNVRELQNAVQYAIVKSNGKTITPSDLPLELSQKRRPSQGKSKPGPSRKLQTDAVRSALIKTGGNKSKAARILGVGRATLYRFLGDHPKIEADLVAEDHRS